MTFNLPIYNEVMSVWFELWYQNERELSFTNSVIYTIHLAVTNEKVASIAGEEVFENTSIGILNLPGMTLNFVHQEKKIDALVKTPVKRCCCCVANSMRCHVCVLLAKRNKKKLVIRMYKFMKPCAGPRRDCTMYWCVAKKTFVLLLFVVWEFYTCNDFDQNH